MDDKLTELRNLLRWQKRRTLMIDDKRYLLALETIVYGESRRLSARSPYLISDGLELVNMIWLCHHADEDLVMIEYLVDRVIKQLKRVERKISNKL